MTPNELANALTALDTPEDVIWALGVVAATGIRAEQLTEIAQLQSQGILKIERNTP